jgi:hypothetical protein
MREEVLQKLTHSAGATAQSGPTKGTRPISRANQCSAGGTHPGRCFGSEPEVPEALNLALQVKQPPPESPLEALSKHTLVATRQ